jgi:hypothetical protein
MLVEGWYLVDNGEDADEYTAVGAGQLEELGEGDCVLVEGATGLLHYYEVVDDISA